MKNTAYVILNLALCDKIFEGSKTQCEQELSRLSQAGVDISLMLVISKEEAEGS